LAFQGHCCKILSRGASSELAKKLVATRYKQIRFFKMVEHSSAPFRYGWRLNSLHRKNFPPSAKNSASTRSMPFSSDKVSTSA
jgi:hypothetical protein